MTKRKQILPDLTKLSPKKEKERTESGTGQLLCLVPCHPMRRELPDSSAKEPS